MRAGEMGVLRCVVCRDAGSGPHPDSPDRHDHRHDSAVAREKEETWVLASPVNPSARHVWDPGLARRPRAAGVCFGSPCAAQEDRRRGGHRWKGTEGRPDSGHQRRRRVDGVLRAQRACSRGLQRPLCVTTFPCVCICMQSSRRSSGLAGAGAGAIDCCPEPSVHDWETGCEVTRQDGTIRGSWAFPFRWTTFCWSARDFCSLLEDEGREKGRGQGPDGDFALLLRQILVERSFLLGASGVENRNQLDHNLNPTSPSFLFPLPSPSAAPTRRSHGPPPKTRPG